MIGIDPIYYIVCLYIVLIICLIIKKIKRKRLFKEYFNLFPNIFFKNKKQFKKTSKIIESPEFQEEFGELFYEEN